MNNAAFIFFAFAFTLIITVIIEKRLIPYLSRRAKQPIYEGGPSWHISKSGTPTMGGLAFLISITISLAACSAILLVTEENQRAALSIIITLLYAVGNSLIGIFDDLMKLHKKENAGLSPMQKLLLQLLLAIIFLMARKYFLEDSTSVDLSFGSIELGVFYYPFAIVLLLGIVNCANLTDGVDGLASSASITVGAAFFVISAITAISELSVLAATLIGGAAGFLIFNKHPAKIFMGDTGSLLLGALAVGLAFCAENPASIIFIGGVYVIEGVSVILQVAYYKLTKKRLFKMAPLHHHLEKCGISENKICVLAIITTVILSALSLFVFRW